MKKKHRAQLGSNPQVEESNLVSLTKEWERLKQNVKEINEHLHNARELYDKASSRYREVVSMTNRTERLRQVEIDNINELIRLEQAKP